MIPWRPGDGWAPVVVDLVLLIIVMLLLLIAASWAIDCVQALARMLVG